MRRCPGSSRSSTAHETLHDQNEALDPLADAEEGVVKNRRQGRLRETVIAALHVRVPAPSWTSPGSP
jgi:hypothetical protein